MHKFFHHREQVEETIKQLRESVDKLHLLEKEYLEQEEKLFVISEFANDWEYWQASDGHYKYVSPSCESVTGYTPQEFYDDPDLLKKIIAFDNWEKWQEHNCCMVRDGHVDPVEFKIHTKNGKSRWIQHICQTVFGKNGESHGIRGSNRDITELKVLQEKLKHMAGHDLLTGLPNRNLFMEHLDQTIKEAKRNGTMFAVVFIDLDDFKAINDSHGHEAGDTVLIRLAQMLTGVTRENDIVARLGGDEFVGIFDVSNDEDIDVIEKKISDNVLGKIHYSTCDISIHFSLGVSLYPVDGRTVDTLLKKADQQMYKQKRINKARRKNKIENT